MVFVACGLNYKTAPIAVREKIALTPSMHETYLNSLLAMDEINEGAILSTCNRTEIYCDAPNPNLITDWLAEQHQLSTKELSPFLYLHEGHHAIRHTLRVASGLDSMMIGEPQILGQMKQAYQYACQLGAVKGQLRPVFEYVFRASKRVRTQSGIGTNPVSIAYAAVQLIEQSFNQLKELNVLLIGSGETASLVAKYLHQQGVKHFIVASRTQDNATKLATQFGGTPISITELTHYLPQADVVITATSCPLPFINKNLIAQALNQRQSASMFLLDLAVPRDIEADVGELQNVHLYNIDDLQEKIEHGMNERRQAAMIAEQLIDHELNNFARWYRTLQSKEVICDYRKQMEQLAELELQRALKKLALGHEQGQVLHDFSKRLVKKLTHFPTTGLKDIAGDDRKDLLGLAQYLFNMNQTAQKANYEEIS